MDYKFIIPTIISIGALIWNLFQQRNIEKLKAKSLKVIQAHKLQFEKEFEIYKVLWQDLPKLRDFIQESLKLAESLKKTKPIIVSEEIQRRLDKKYNETFLLLRNIRSFINLNQPFFAPEIYKETHNFYKLTSDPKFNNIFSGEPSIDLNPLITTIEKIENICTSIRKRIYLDDIN